jgi:hypothetical protein
LGIASTSRPSRLVLSPSRLLLIAVVGIGLIAAPAVFQMFTRAPLGGQMIDDFHPFMTEAKVVQFRDYLAEIDAAHTESVTTFEKDLFASGRTTSATFATDFASVADWNSKWPAISADMNDLIDRMDHNLGNFQAVEALPPFPLFPWFFVVPGVLLAGITGSAEWSRRRGSRDRKRTWALLAIGGGLLLAPVAFQMFTRAPEGRDMIADFRPMMTPARVQNVQFHFVTLGAAEGQLRVQALPLASKPAGTYPAIERWSADWPSIVHDFNPMIATMADSLDNFAAVDALPPFNLFPWFFVIPGALVIGLATAGLRRPHPGPG